MAYTLFLSHNATDAKVVNEIKKRSAAAGVTIYTYEEDVRAGTLLSDKLTSAIRGSDGLIAILTRNGATRPAIQQEIGVAVGLEKPVFALVEDGVDPATLTLLQGLEYIRLDLEAIGDALSGLQQSIDHHRTKIRNGILITAAVLVALIVILKLGGKE